MYWFRVVLGSLLFLVLTAFPSYLPTTSAKSTIFSDSAGLEQPGKDQAVRTADLFPLKERTNTFRVTDGEKLDQRLVLSLRSAGDTEPGEWVLEFSDLNTIYLSVDDGHLMMERVELPPAGFAIEYAPPVRMVPADIRPHVRIEEESRAKIYNLETGKLERKGTVQHEIKSPSRSTFVTDVGEFEGYLIPIKQEINVSWASIQMELTGGLVPGVGMAYRRLEYTRKTLGFFGETTRRTAVLSEEVKQ